MRITILNGEPHTGSDFDRFVFEYAEDLEARGHVVTRLDLRELSIRGCSGCWGCWVKTPGECVKRDDSEQICRAVLGSDLTVWASPVVMGFTTELLKRAADQMVPLVHPYIVVEGGELHHRPRYAHYPEFALLLASDAGTDAEDIEITRAMWSRTARNMKSRLVATTIATATTPKEAADELASVA